VQFQHFTRQVFVQAGDARAFAFSAWAARQAARKVESGPAGCRCPNSQHARAAPRRAAGWQIAGDVRPDGFTFKGANDAAHAAFGR
jgi:hypothetical protein